MSSSPVVFSQFNACWAFTGKVQEVQVEKRFERFALTLWRRLQAGDFGFCGAILLSSVYRRLEFYKLLICHDLAGILIAEP